MLAIAYWNIHKGSAQNIVDAIVDLAVDICTDINLSGPNGELLLCLAEPGKVIDFSNLLKMLQSKTPGKLWWIKQAPLTRFVVLGNVSKGSAQFPPTEIGQAVPCQLTRIDNGIPANYDIWFVHLASPAFAWMGDVIGLDQARFLRQDIELRERQLKPRASLAIGDFNMEPFDMGMVATSGMNATPCQHVANTGPKEVRPGDFIEYFFNPMWKLLGSWTHDFQPGSFFRKEASHSVRWHLIDQVVVRPSLTNSIQANTPLILTKAGKCNLTTTAGAIGKTSDHLPVLVSLDI